MYRVVVPLLCVAFVSLSVGVPLRATVRSIGRLLRRALDREGDVYHNMIHCVLCNCVPWLSSVSTLAIGPSALSRDSVCDFRPVRGTSRMPD